MSNKRTKVVYDVERHYDAISDSYRVFERYNPRKHIIIGDLFTKTVGSLAGLSALDMGCGEGFFSELSKDLGARRVVGVDISQNNLI